MSFSEICIFSGPVDCGEDSMPCTGSMDDNGCMSPDFCWPSKGKIYRISVPSRSILILEEPDHPLGQYFHHCGLIPKR